MRSIDKTTSREALYLLMTNQKKVRDDFRFIDLNTHEKVSIEECYDIVIKDLEVLDILKRNIFVADNTIYATPNELNNDDYKKVKEWMKNDK